MKRILLLGLVLGLCAGQASAALWELDRLTALQFTNIAGGADDTVGALSVYDGPDATLYPKMSGQVGFVAALQDNDGFNADAFLATATVDAGDDAGLGGATLYDGITSYFQNDNDDIWSVQLFYVDAGGEHNSGAFVLLAGAGGSTYLTVWDPEGSNGLDLDDITNIGFRVQGNMVGPDLLGNPSQGDAFHMSLVPVPGAVLLGFLGLGAAGLKLRRFA